MCLFCCLFLTTKHNKNKQKIIPAKHPNSFCEKHLHFDKVRFEIQCVYFEVSVGLLWGGEISAIWWASVPLVNCCYKNSILRRFSGRGAGGGTLKAPDGGQANRLTTQK